jgi:hypothetical protein
MSRLTHREWDLVELTQDVLSSVKDFRQQLIAAESEFAACLDGAIQVVLAFEEWAWMWESLYRDVDSGMLGPHSQRATQPSAIWVSDEVNFSTASEVMTAGFDYLMPQHRYS